MRRLLALAGGLFLSLSTVQAFHPAKYDGTSESWLDRVAQRTPLRTPYFRYPADHTAQRAGYPQSIRTHAIPSITCYDHAGYVGGARLKHNNLLARGPGSATGPIYEGTFATDYTGVRAHMGRVFLAPSADPSKGRSFSRGYWAEGPRVTNVFALRPFYKAKLEKNNDLGRHGCCGPEEHGGGHDAAVHGAEAGHQ